MAKAKTKVSKQIQQLFLRLLNFQPELLAKAQEEANRQNTTLDNFIRTAVEKYLKALTVARDQQEAKAGGYARLLLRAHFLEDRNECLSEDAIRSIGSETSSAVGDSKPQ
jgi:hypothetical protein